MLTETIPADVDANGFDLEYSDLVDRIIDTQVRIIVTMDHN